MTFNADLIRDLARHRVVPFLGAGVSASANTVGGNKIAGWKAFLGKAALELPEPSRATTEQLIQKSDLLIACELIQSTLKDRWSEIVMAEFGQAASPSALHKAIYSLNQRIIITTNFDKLLEMTWGAEGTGGTHYPRVITRVDDKIFRTLKGYDERFLIKIHGSVDDPDSLVFSRSEYIRLAFGNDSYMGFLENILLNFTILFIGFSMDDPAITSLMERYAFRYPNARPHYIVSPSDIPEYAVDIHKRLRKLYVIQYDPDEHHSQLPQLLNDLAAESRRYQRTLIADMVRELDAAGRVNEAQPDLAAR